MKKIFVCFVLVVFGCSNPTQRINNKAINEVVIQDFNSFYSKFYNDSSFQHERILRPLKGTIKAWENDSVKEESWNNKRIIVTPKENFMQVYKNLKTDLIKRDSSAIEKYWIDQSGFIIEKKFILKSNKWYLYIYNISNL